MKKYFTLYLALLVMAVCAVFFMHTLVRAVFYAPDSGIQVASAQEASMQTISSEDMVLDVASTTATSSAPALASTSTVSKYPSRLLIPSLHIDAHVQFAGVTAAGNMGTPNNFTDVAWYKYGTIPGAVGSAVIDGHVDNGLALAGVFKHLADIQTGADIYVTTEGSSSLHFTVTSIDVYDYKSVPIKDVFNDQDGAEIRLITCGGTWVPGERTYDKRIVVTATLIK